SVVKRILANDFIWVLDGKLLDKKAAVEGAANGPGPFLSNEPDYVHVRIFGDTAVAQGSETWTKKGGRRGKFVWTDTWVKRAGCWQIVNAQDTVVPLAAE
ncbi:MAG: nuclear transport factor 2 family protein, partial [Sphingomicrobium sp.]